MFMVACMKRKIIVSIKRLAGKGVLTAIVGRGAVGAIPKVLALSCSGDPCDND